MAKKYEDREQVFHTQRYHIRSMPQTSNAPTSSPIDLSTPSSDETRQHTLARAVRCEGVGLHSGEQVQMVLHPAEENSGILFVREDVKGFHPVVPARYDYVSATQLGTTLSNEDGTLVSTVEHIMAALWGCGVDNARIALTGPEIPIMDGSSEPFVFLIECAGVVAQTAPRKQIVVREKVEVCEAEKRITLLPADRFSVHMDIDFDSRAIAKQRCEFDSSAVSFKTDLCRARTFGFAEEVEHLQRQGLARGGSMENAIVVEKGRVLNDEGLRYRDEFVRHKVLDCIGDLFLAGGRLLARVEASRTGHTLNNRVLHALFASKHAWGSV